MKINGQESYLEVGISVSEMLCKLDIKEDKVIIEINLEIIPKDKYAETKLNQDDKVEIVTFMGGG
ncbi:sulfur carrier protein [Desulfonispora thiosulfatigenes DSM 11270]|uniref:Sulfur carrier protein n=1 Tax=Desulfonispora thiosulfatigenes DSM 11270 TaxID=656914 RepID=A0A1W1V1X8_DESTI|nr:sulfur carrier protein ThiS [Desulfonispora thiosulfatigenes]SMB87325.1 sulfur carrier protein [Desulfonispora thiosulfatigenes DSM 11270]